MNCVGTKTLSHSKFKDYLIYIPSSHTHTHTLSLSLTDEPTHSFLQLNLKIQLCQVVDEMERHIKIVEFLCQQGCQLRLRLLIWRPKREELAT